GVATEIAQQPPRALLDPGGGEALAHPVAIGLLARLLTLADHVHVEAVVTRYRGRELADVEIGGDGTQPGRQLAHGLAGYVGDVLELQLARNLFQIAAARHAFIDRAGDRQRGVHLGAARFAR